MAATTKIVSSNPRLQSILDEVTKGQIKIPVFQREYVWNDDQVMSLLDSIYRGYPVGSLLLWSTKEPLQTHREVGGFQLPDLPEDYPVQYVLDGQQRLTTLYAVFNSEMKTTDPDLSARFKVSFNPSDEEFMHDSVADPSSTIRLLHVLDTARMVKEFPRFSETDQNTIAALQERFKDYEFPTVTIRERSNQEVCRVFQRINSSGTQLSTIDLLSAWTWSGTFDLREQISDLQDRLSSKGYDELGDTQIMRCLSAIAQMDVSTDKLVDTDPNDLVAAMETLRQAMDAAVDFLSDEFKIKNSVFIPFPIMLVPLVFFFSKTLKPSHQQRSALKRWFWYCAFTQRYKAGTNKLVREDLESMRKLADNEAHFDSLKAEVSPDLFKKTWRINSTAAKATICMLAQSDPKSLLSAAPINLDSTLAAYNSREFHHIYPKAYLSSLGINFHRANVIANICMITASDNKVISNSSPSKYFGHIPTASRDDIFARSFIEPKFRDGSLPFADFVGGRAAYLARVAEGLISSGELTL